MIVGLRRLRAKGGVEMDTDDTGDGPGQPNCEVARVTEASDLGSEYGNVSDGSGPPAATEGTASAIGSF